MVKMPTGFCGEGGACVRWAPWKSGVARLFPCWRALNRLGWMMATRFHSSNPGLRRLHPPWHAGSVRSHPSPTFCTSWMGRI